MNRNTEYRQSPAPQPPPRAGTARVAWFRELRAAVAHDVLWLTQDLREAGWPEDAIADTAENYRAWLIGQIDVAITEADVLGRWSS